MLLIVTMFLILSATQVIGELFEIPTSGVI